MKSCLFIYNPNTGGNKLKNHFHDIVALLTEAGYEPTLHATQGPGDARDTTARRGAGFDLVVCCGGDGTLNETVTGLQECTPQPLLGYLPGGTTNDFAASLGLPRNDLMAAARRIVQPEAIFQCDLGLFGGRTFNYIAAFGAFTDVSYSTDQKAKDNIGYLAYVFSAMGRLTKLPAITAHVTVGGEALDGDFIFGAITNTRSVGGFTFRQEQLVELDDGQFELILVRQPHNIGELGELSRAMLRGDLDSPLLEIRHVQQVQVCGETPISWTLDGEFGGELDCIDIGVKPRAFSICV